MTDLGPELGLDIGATLAKIARRSRAGSDTATNTAGPTTELEFLPSSDLGAVADHVTKLRPSRVGITGAGATPLSKLLSCHPQRVDEFEAWGAGAARLLSRIGSDELAPAAGERFLLVSLGTGTSVLLIEANRARRVGGTALGGGTLIGLGAALTGASFEELCEMARAGSAAAVDLRIADIYEPHEIPLAGHFTAANFVKLGRELTSARGKPAPASAERRADLAAGVMGLIGENIALICAGLAAATEATGVVYAGFTVRDNPRLIEILGEVTTLCGHRAYFLPDGEFAGALGALELAHAPA
jgi:type II pantothenate kinase